MNDRHFLHGGKRAFLRWLAGLGFAGALPAGWADAAREVPRSRAAEGRQKPVSGSAIELFMCGDVMTGRGIDQVLPHPGAPHLYEPYVRDARRYVQLAEAVNGPVGGPVDFAYLWGDALEVLETLQPDIRLINLETAVTATDEPWPEKGIHYRMHPRNLPAISAGGIHCCTLANNHVLDWGFGGLADTLELLHRAGIATVGAGQDRNEACAPAILEVPLKGRVVVVGVGHRSSGIPRGWGAQPGRPGVCLLGQLSGGTPRDFARRLSGIKRPGDVLVVSIHWGGNWGYQIPEEQRRFARGLIDEAGVDVVHGHSSHHVKGIEVYQGRLVLYGCGDFFNDYEGIGGYDEFRGDLSLMYFATLDPGSGQLEALRMIPTQVRRFRINRAGAADVRWLRERLNREGNPFGTRVEIASGQSLELHWD
jgi:poly-gamma-glutamate synthesis protein (capsule biosynthesis protein)